MRALIYSVRPVPVLKYFGQLCFMLGLLSLVPLVVSLITGAYNVSFRYLAVIGLTVAVWLALRRLPTPKNIQTNEAMVITALVFLFTPLVMVWPFSASAGGFIDSLFETVSAVTTTGLSVLPSIEDKPAVFLFSRAWTQWVGGLGIVVLSVATMIRPGLAARRIGDMEEYEEDLVGSTRVHARRVIIVYSALTVFGVIVLGLLGTGWFNGVLYAFSAISTGGFASHDASLAGLPGVWQQAMVILLSTAGAVPLVLYYRSIKEGAGILAGDRQVQWLLIFGVVFALLLSLFFFTGGLNWSQALIHGFLNSFSAQSTAGFSTIDLSGINDGARVTLIFSMLLGGCAGSTAGGIKILRLLIIAQVLHVFLRRAALPRHAVAEPRIGRRRLDQEEIQPAMGIVFFYLACIAVSWLIFVGMGHNALDSLFEVVSAIATAGMSSGISAPELHPVLKLVLCADMLLGRLEIIAWIILLNPRTWIGRRMEGMR